MRESLAQLASRGQCYPLGATVRSGGVNFCVFSRNCTSLELLLFDDVDAAGPARVIRLDPNLQRTFYYWHIFVPGLKAGQLYGFRAAGPFQPEQGHRFDGTKVLLDPYGRAVAYGNSYQREAARHPGDNGSHCMKSVVMDPRAYDWEGDVPPRRAFGGSVIYEMHVAGFTRHPSSGVAAERRGTYAGVIERIPHLQELGVTAVELLPVLQFDEQELRPGCRDYWGYNPVAFFAPHRGYSSSRAPLGPVNEFRDMVKALHRAGIEVILDVVFNHTGEGDHTGPTTCFRGLENRAYYILEQDRSRYANFSGCGNTFNGNHSIVRRLILDSLHYWVQVMHVDGFRFDLASVLSRDETGAVLRNPPILWEIESDPILAGCKIIAEAWDAAGLYQVGTFIGHRWAEWNGQYRDVVRRFVKSDASMVGPLAYKLRGSPDVYPDPDRDPHRSINFVTCHDGFTLHDLVAYNDKHNEANGENNRDGTNDNHSWNCGQEGPSSDPAVHDLRQRQMKNVFTILLLSQGTPMFLMGDEVAHTQSGNNNAYCQDNPISWFDWGRVDKQAGLLRFVQRLIHFRQHHRLFDSERFWTSVPEPYGAPQIAWHGTRLDAPDWGWDARTLAYSLRSADGMEHVHVMLNAFWEGLDFELPVLPAGLCWYRVLDTGLGPPDDFAEPGSEPPVTGNVYRVRDRAAAVLLAR
ncbi:MAG: glycogen debranching protein GlgX [Gemmataceae bacterium]